MNKAYTRINWENYPSETTPLNESNLNKMDYAVNEIDNRVIGIDTTKLDIITANSMVKNVSYDSATGIFTVTYLNGSTANIDTKLEKLAVNFAYDVENERLVITLDDGTVQYVDLKALITQYEFDNTDTISFVISADGKVHANVNNGSISGEMLQPNYLADITVQAGIAQQGANNAEVSASEAEASAVRAEAAAEHAEEITNVSIATNTTAGIVKGNADEIDIAADGKLSINSSFTPQEVLTEVTGTEDKKTLFGKIAKTVSDLIAHIANTSIHFGLTNNLLATVAGTALDATQGKTLDDKITTINQNLTVHNPTFIPNAAGLTANNITCGTYGKICVMYGTFTPNQSGSGLVLGAVPILPTNNAVFNITTYSNASASYGYIRNTDGAFICHIQPAMVGVTCAINITFWSQ